MTIKNRILDRLRWMKRAYYRNKYHLKHVDHRFLATKGLKKVNSTLIAGAYSYVGPDCRIYPNVVIGKYTLLANNVSIIGGDHNYRTPGVPTVFNGRDTAKRTVIGDDVWIGAHTIIMCGVEIGNGAIVAAGSVVVKDVEPYAIYAGVPAKKIKMRFSPAEIEIHEEMLRKPESEYKAYYKLPDKLR